MVAHRLRLAIRAGDYAVGDRLPSQRDLATKFDVAQNTAREAIRILASEGLVVPQHGKGVFVSAPFRMAPTSPGGYFTGSVLEASEQNAAADFTDVPAYAMAGQLFLCLRNTLEDATWIDSWRVTRTRIVVEWDRGASIQQVLEQVLPRSEGGGDTEFVNGVPGLRVIKQSYDTAELGWLHIPSSHALLRRYEQ